MKKIHIILMILVFLATSRLVTASITVDFIQSAFVQSTAGTSLANPALVLLVWDNNSVATFSSITAGFNSTAGAQLADGDYILWSGNTDRAGGFLPSLGTDIDLGAVYTDASVGSQTILNGSLYALVFSSASPIAGSYYGARASTDNPLRDASGSPKPPSNSMDFSTNTGAGRMILNSVTQYGGYQVLAVPEPSTIGLLLVGAGLVAFRRMRRS